MGDGQGRGGEEAFQLALDQGLGLVLGEPAHRFQLGLVGGGVVAVDVGHQAHHQRRGPRPGLAGVVADGGGGQAGLFHQLAGAGLLDGLAGLEEAGQGREHAGRPGRLAAQQAAAVVQGQHDRHRVGAREVLGLAGRAQPRFQPPSVTLVSWPQLLHQRCACGAIRTSTWRWPGCRRRAAAGSGRRRAAPRTGPGPAAAPRPDRPRPPGRRRTPRCPSTGPGTAAARAWRPGPWPCRPADRRSGRPAAWPSSPRTSSTSGLAVPDGHGQRVRVGGLLGQPGLVAPALAGAVERIAGEDVGDDRKGHGEVCSIRDEESSRRPHERHPTLQLASVAMSRDIGLGDR
jgi:hypothetical protein